MLGVHGSLTPTAPEGTLRLSLAWRRAKRDEMVVAEELADLLATGAPPCDVWHMGFDSACSSKKLSQIGVGF